MSVDQPRHPGRKRRGVRLTITVSDFAWAALLFVIGVQSTCITVLLMRGGGQP